MLLPIEVIALGLRFDVETLADRTDFWAAWLGHSHHAPRLAAAAAAATLLLGGVRLRSAMRSSPAGLARPRPARRAFLASHLIAFVTFAWLTARVLEGGPGAGRPAMVAAWAAAGLATLLLWGAVLLPPRDWLPLARRESGLLLAGAVVGALAWAAGRATDELWRPLGWSTMQVVHGLLRLCCRETVYRPDEFIVGTPSFAVRIAPSCSGYEGIGLLWALLGGYFWFARRSLRFPRALLLIPIGTALIWLANAARIAALIGVGGWISQGVALGGFHSQAGWLAFNAVGLGLIAIAQRAPFFAAVAPGRSGVVAPAPAPATADDAPAAETPADAGTTAAYLAPLLALVAAVMVTGAFTDGFDRLYPIRILAVALALWAFRRRYAGRGRRWAWSWEAAGLGVVVYAVWLALEPAAAASDGGRALAEGLAALPAGWAAAWLAARVVGSVVTVPIAEELAFRGYLIRRLIAADFRAVPAGRFTWASFAISSVLFGLMHGRWLAGSVAGMLFALALYRRGRLADAVVAHAVANALIAAHVFATGSWALWA